MRKNIDKMWIKYIVLSMLTGSLLYATGDTYTVNQDMIHLILGSFMAGLLLTFTPCVLPMVPILSSIIVGQGEGMSKSKAVFFSIVYVLGTTVIYALMGALAGATGEQLQSYFQNAWVIGIVSLVFALMALSMFGLFTIQLPSFIQTRLTGASAKIKGGSVPMVFLMGMISALVLGACVSPILIAFLGVAITKGSAWLGAVTMFFMALGMGVPLILLGFGMGHLLPKAGEWMDKVKYTFGVLLLATAIYIFNSVDILPPLLLWGIFLVILSIYLGATEPLNEGADGWQKLFKGIGVVLLLWGIILMIGAAYGQKDFLRPLPVLKSTSGLMTKAAHAKSREFVTVKNLEELRQKQEDAKNMNKLLAIFFYSDTCGSCKKIKATTFKDAAVLGVLKKNFILVNVNITHHADKESQAIKQYFHVFGPPTFVFFDRGGEEIAEQRLYGYQAPEEFLDVLELLAE